MGNRSHALSPEGRVALEPWVYRIRVVPHRVRGSAQSVRCARWRPRCARLPRGETRRGAVLHAGEGKCGRLRERPAGRGERRDPCSPAQGYGIHSGLPQIGLVCWLMWLHSNVNDRTRRRSVSKLTAYGSDSLLGWGAGEGARATVCAVRCWGLDLKLNCSPDVHGRARRRAEPDSPNVRTFL